MPKLYITLTPQEVNKIEKGGCTIVLIDTLRATTTMITAFASGVREIIPFTSTVELKEITAGKNERDCLICGEIRGVPGQGYNLGNSPGDYRPQIVAGKIIFFKSTNGTAVLKMLPSDNIVLLGALVNSKAVCKKIVELNRDVYLACAGTRKKFSLEDFLTAGCLTTQLFKKGWVGGDLETAAARIFEHNHHYNEIVNLFFHSRNGQNLIKLGYKDDIFFASQQNIFSVVPCWDGKKIFYQK